jgi:hypothetical protein
MEDHGALCDRAAGEARIRTLCGTIQDARNVARANLEPRFGRDTPLYAIDRHEIIVRRNGRQLAEIREERRDTFTTDDVDAYRRELLASHLSPRTAQKILNLLHGVFKLAKRRKLIATNPSEDAERVTLDDPGVFQHPRTDRIRGRLPSRARPARRPLDGRTGGGRDRQALGG